MNTPTLVLVALAASARASSSSSQAVVFVTRELDTCRAERVRAILNSTSREFDIIVLHDKTSPPALGLLPDSPRLIVTAQPDRPDGEGWASFGLNSHGILTPSGTSKQAFLLWLVDSKYDFAWHVEDDVVYTGRWAKLLRVRHAVACASQSPNDPSTRHEAPPRRCRLRSSSRPALPTWSAARPT